MIAYFSCCATFADISFCSLWLFIYFLRRTSRRFRSYLSKLESNLTWGAWISYCIPSLNWGSIDRETHKNIQANFVINKYKYKYENTPKDRTVRKWFVKFRSGDNSDLENAQSRFSKILWMDPWSLNDDTGVWCFNWHHVKSYTSCTKKKEKRSKLEVSSVYCYTEYC